MKNKTGKRKPETGAHASSVSDIRHPCRVPRGKVARQDAPLGTQDACAPGGFTLIELLVVIAIIAILAGLVLSTAGFVQKKGAMSRAQAEIAAMEAALESYKADMGDYPTGTNDAGGDNKFLRASLSPATNKVYFEFSKGMGESGMSTTNTNQLIADPFGTSYGYKYPGDADRSGTNFFDLYSTAGSSTATTNEPRWIKNW